MPLTVRQKKKKKEYRGKKKKTKTKKHLKVQSFKSIHTWQVHSYTFHKLSI